MTPVKRKHQHGISPHRPSVPGPCSVLPRFFVVLYIVREEPQCPVWLYDVIRGINLLIIVITIVVIPLAAGALTLTRCDSQYVACLPTPRHKTRFAPGCPAHESEIFFERCHSHGNRQSQQHGRRPYQQVRIYRAGRER